MLRQFQEYIHPERPVAVIREISKMFEEVKRGTIQELIDFSEQKELKGEIVVVVSAI
jgi:16S rRNA (cytidine1402-2'-O)-methyltransferase